MGKTVLKAAALCGAIVSLLLLSGGEASAQRTVSGQFFVSGDFMAAVHPAGSGVTGGEVFVGQYRGSFYWSAGVQFTTATEKAAFGCATAAGGVMYRFVETRSRFFNMYAGGLVLLGADYARGRKPVEDLVVNPDTGAIDTSGEDVPEGKTQLVVGVEPRVEIELFPFGGFALVGGVSLPLKFVTQQDVFSARVYAGLRLNF